MYRMLLCAVMITLANAAIADDQASFEIAGDRFLAGETVTHVDEGADDLFMAGETVRSEAAVAGSAHLAGRRVIVHGDVGGDIYAAGMDVSLKGDVVGDATAAGYDVSVSRVGGDLRATGSRISVGGRIGGYALIAGEDVQIDSVLGGDASIAARSLGFGPEARIDGQLTLYEEEPGELDVPESVVPAERIERRDIERWEEEIGEYRPFSWGRLVASFLTGVIIVAGLAILVASLVPEHLAELRRRILRTPFRTLWLGFLTQAAVVGSALLFAMTLIGIIVSPAAILVAFLAGLAGYVVAVYALGVWLTLAFGRAEPDSIRDRALAAGIGGLAAGIVVLIPLLGWLFILAMALTGVGAISQRLFRPRFFTDAA